MSKETDPIAVQPTSNTALPPTNSGRHTTPGKEVTGGNNDPAQRSREAACEELQENPHPIILKKPEQPNEIPNSEGATRALDKQSGPSEAPGISHNIPLGTPEEQVVAVPDVSQSNDPPGRGSSHKDGNDIRQFTHVYPSLVAFEPVLRPPFAPPDDDSPGPGKSRNSSWDPLRNGHQDKETPQPPAHQDQQVSPPAEPTNLQHPELHIPNPSDPVASDEVPISLGIIANAEGTVLEPIDNPSSSCRPEKSQLDVPNPLTGVPSDASNTVSYQLKHECTRRVYPHLETSAPTTDPKPAPNPF